MRSSAVIILLASVSQAHAEEFKPKKAPVNTVGHVKTTFDSKAAWPPKITGARDGDLESSGTFNVDRLGDFQWSLKASGADFSNPSWPPNFLAKLGSSWDTPLGKVHGSVESPVSMSWPQENNAEVSVSLRTKKDFGDFCSSLKCTTSSPFSAKSISSIKFEKDVAVSNLGDFSCAVETNPDLVTTASLKHTRDTPVGPVCCKLETTTNEWPPQNPTWKGSLNMKKNLGDICCNMKMTNTGALQCTFEAASKLTTVDLAENSQDVMGISAMFLISAFVGSGITLAVFRLRRVASTASREWLLAA